jgi:hypothetical protein
LGINGKVKVRHTAEKADVEKIFTSSSKVAKPSPNVVTLSNNKSSHRLTPKPG